MTAQQLATCLRDLDIEQPEAAQLLDVDPRTVRRWLDGEAVPGPVEQAFRAWLRLHKLGVAWRPDSVSIFEDDQQQISAHRLHAIELDEILERVKARGGPRLPWHVDRIKCRASCGKMEVTFYKLTNGGFSLAQYRRTDIQPDVRRDRELIEDATWYVAQEMRKDAEIPVTLIYLAGTSFVGADGKFATMQHEEFPSNEAAIQRVCELIKLSHLTSFAIRTGTTNTLGEFLWNEPELRAECERRNHQERKQPTGGLLKGRRYLRR
jgi:hypothetical protein